MASLTCNWLPLANWPSTMRVSKGLVFVKWSTVFTA
jgi:hypothetical protein